MKSATDQVALQLGMKTARNVSTTLRQPAFEFKLIPSLWVGGLIQAAVGGGSGGFLTNVLDWIGRRGRGFSGGLRRPRRSDRSGPGPASSGRCSMVMILIIPIEEATAEGLCVLDAAEPLRKLRLIF
jgi:hypothetical protein